MLRFIQVIKKTLRFLTNQRREFENIPGFKREFAKESSELAVSRVRTLKTIGLTCYSAFGIVDWILYPHLIQDILIVRVGFALILGASLFFSRTAWWKKNAAFLLFICALTGELGISYLASQISGWSSLYFVGNIVVTTGVVLFIPWRPIFTILYCTLSLVGYFFINLLYHPLNLEVLMPLMFLFIIGVEAYLSSLIDERNRKKQLASRFAIESAHDELRQQSELLQKQIAAAKDIQQALLPPLIQEIGGFKIEALYEPSADLSGDFFDVIVCEDWIYIYLADVTGHGLPAAQITFLVKEIFKTALVEEVDLSTLFNIVRTKYIAHQLNYDLALQLVRINKKSMKIDYLRSNSPCPISIIGTAAAVEQDVAPSPPISRTSSASSSHPAKVTSSVLDPKTKLYLYSDGAFEFFAANNRHFGERKLVRALENTRFDEWPRGLWESLVSENIEKSFPDDLTVIRISNQD